MKSVSATYIKQTHRENILSRPDTYVGTTSNISEDRVIIFNDEFVQKNCKYSPALLKIIDELLVNAIDASKSDKTLNTIKINIDTDTNKIIVYNNGKGIPVVLHDEYKIYIPELIFGHLLTSSNYDDNDNRECGGRNGYGAKLTNIYSSEFTVKTNTFSQTFKNNMEFMDKPIISKNKTKGVEITFYPDLKKFGLSSIDSFDNLPVIKKRVIDLCAVTPNRISIYFNDTLINIPSFKDYVLKYSTSSIFSSLSVGLSDIISEKPNKWNISVVPSLYQLNSPFHVSFVNGIFTNNGGSHVDFVYNSIFNVLKKKNKDITLLSVKKHILLFINANIINPSFTSQSKDTCNSKITIEDINISKTFLDNICKSNILDGCLNDLKKVSTNQMSKTDGKKKNKLYIPKLDDANKAGTSQSSKCTICFTEGDSAKASVVSGFSVVGRDFWGAFPLRGKLLNVSKAKTNDIIKNEEINNIKKILGLESGKHYTDVSSLRYGRIMICTDQDLDGYHIRGLLMNLFKEFWPSLFSLDGFIVSLNTPIVKIINPNSNIKPISFYNMQTYTTFINSNPDISKKCKHKYYKGLGTSNTSEAKSYFQNISSNTLSYSHSDNSDSSFDLAFSPILADNRKEWLTSSVNNEPEETTISYHQFIHTQLKKFSNEDNIRSIPHIADGLKPSTRKILYTCLLNQSKVTKNNEIKVCDLAGLVSQTVSYHHGDASLQGAIIGMAQNFVGSNNINLLLPNGQFGTREQGGSDHASARYINTQLNPIVPSLFRADDLNILEYVYDDGKKVEPAFFIPTIPLLLINGSKGIGTGHSTNIPPHNPVDVINNIKLWLDNKPLKPISPWFNGFTGKISRDSPSQFTTYGVFTVTNKNNTSIVNVTELPIGLWTNNFRDLLLKLMTTPNKIVKNFDIHTKDDKPNFIIYFYEILSPEKILSTLKLKTSINTNNMTVFIDNTIKSYNNSNDIIIDFCKLSLQKYITLKNYNINKLNEKLLNLSIEIKFINLVINETIICFKRSTADIINDINKHIELNNYPVQDLIDMPMSRFTTDKITKLEENYDKIKNELSHLKNTDINNLWINDINSIKL